MSIHALLVCSLSLVFFFSCYGDHPDLHSFPTRRSSDLIGNVAAADHAIGRYGELGGNEWPPEPLAGEKALVKRSEEHTSELQSQSNLVCRLLLEKKKKKHYR